MYSHREDVNEIKVANESSNTISVKVPNAYNIVSLTASAPLTLNTKNDDNNFTKENTPEKKLEIRESKDYTDGPKAAGHTLGF